MEMSDRKIDIFKQTAAEDYLETAIQTANYIKKFEINTKEGKYWAISGAEDKKPDSIESSFLDSRSLYAGAAGIGYFFIQIYEATNDRTWLKEAASAGNYLVSTYEEKLSENPGIHNGTSGEGVFLKLLYDKTDDKKYLKQVIKIADDIYALATKDEAGTHWNGYFDFMGDGGAVLYFLLVAEITSDSRYVKYAGEVLDSILKLSVDYGKDSIYWKLFDPHEFFKSVPAGGIVPNFAHGTAGIVYLLTKYYQTTGDAAYLNEAIKGCNFLREIAINEGNASIVPYIYLEEEKKAYDILYLGYCHGPVGDGIAIWELYKATGDKSYLQFYKQLTEALVQAGLPEKRSAGYWNDCLCCGSAGVLLHFLKASDLNKEYLSYAKRTANKTVGDAYKDKDGYRWYNAWTRIKPWDVDSHLGLFVGAAGSASALLSIYGKLENVDVTPLFEYQ